MMDMRTSKYSEEQIIGFLRLAEAGMPLKMNAMALAFQDGI
jgi:hypothetical protein